MTTVLQEIFYWTFNMSISAAITGSIVMLIRKIPKIPKRITVLLWIIPFFRLIFPIGLNSPYSLMSLLSRITTKTVVVYQPTKDVAFSMTNHLMFANSYFPITYKANSFEQIFGAASLIWIIIAAAILLTLAALYFTTLHELKDAKHLKDNIYLSEKIVSPAVYGITKPKIIIPASFSDEDMQFILLHEMAHIRRGDNLRRMIAFIITALHWFNPLAWVFLNMLLSDIELACDERVLMSIGDDSAKDYARSLLNCHESANVFASAFGGAKIRTRIENILSFKKLTLLSTIVFLLLLITIFYVLLTNAG